MLNNKNNYIKIGIFDSGVGGLTVAHAINNILPKENLLYIGDTAHSPWGDKSTSQIISYAVKLTSFLINNNCTIVVIACHTASCVALNAINAIVEQATNIKLFNVIDPTISHLQQLNLNNFRDIGIIGTKQTIHSKAYQSRLEKLASTNKQLQIKSLATPLLVPLIEEGWLGNSATNLIIEEYLSQLNLRDQSILILGCTHYPLIKQHIEDYYLKLNKKITVIDSASLISHQIKKFLQDTNQLNNNLLHANNFYCTDNSEFFLQTARQFFANINLNFLPLWK